MRTGTTQRARSDAGDGARNRRFLARPARWIWAIVWAAGFIALTAGCASPRHGADHLPKAGGLAAVQAPSFLNGPIGVLLTNRDDFSARVVVSGGDANAVPLTGNLFQQEGQLLFVPTTEASPGRKTWTGSFRFLWDLNRHRGFIISEALHGYAAIVGLKPYMITTRSTAAGPGATERIDEQPCTIEEAIVSSKDGTELVCRVWRAVDLGGIPLQIQSATNTNAIAVQLSHLNVERLSPELFSLPEGATRYGSPEAMVAELTRTPPVMPYSSQSGARSGRSR